MEINCKNKKFSISVKNGLDISFFFVFQGLNNLKKSVCLNDSGDRERIMFVLCMRGYKGE